jgi:hypothetical protein
MARRPAGQARRDCAEACATGARLARLRRVVARTRAQEPDVAGAV